LPAGLIIPGQRKLEKGRLFGSQTFQHAPFFFGPSLQENMTMQKRMNRPLAVKSMEENGLFEGYASVFHVEDHYRDVVVPGAFAKSLDQWHRKGGMPALLWSHRHDSPIGVYETMEEDDHGLLVRGRLLVDDIALARETYALMKAGAVNGLSIGYRPVVEDYDKSTGINTLKEIDLWETSLVVFPANEAATITGIKTVREFEGFLRDAGFSKKEACRIASRGFDDQGELDQEHAIIAQLIIKNIQLLEV
jgi:HK97 family phage prohead protease